MQIDDGAAIERKNQILIVDDDRSNIVALNGILKPEYSTLTAINGKAAIEIAKSAAPDLILLDIVMPESSGFEIIAELKREDALRRIPVIFITALDSVQDEEKGFALGAVDYITKPFHNSIVRARVKTHLQMAAYIREIERYGRTDTLTGLANRRSFDERINIEWNRALRKQEPLSVLMIDADKFKLYNDTHGHMQGDVLLKTIAKVFAKSVKRASDIAARWGGEEFAVLLPNTALDMAIEIAEHIRANIAETMIPLPDGTPTSITISIGVNAIVPSHDSAVNDFLVKADNNLYAAKEAGRNRVAY